MKKSAANGEKIQERLVIASHQIQFIIAHFFSKFEEEKVTLTPSLMKTCAMITKRTRALA